MSETAISHAIREALELAGHVVVRVNSGGYARRMRGAKKGTSDILGCRRGDGRFFALEVKRDEKEKPTVEQLAFLARVRGCGGIAEIVTTAEQALDALVNTR